MGKSSSPDTSELEQATKEATALQKQMYEEGREDVQPWYQMGTGAVSKLSDLLGISGGTMQSRQGIYDDLAGQYTTTKTIQPKYKTLISATKATDRYTQADSLADAAARVYNNKLRAAGATKKDIIDYDGLNAAVDAQYNAQVEPENYGSLLQKFGMEQFEEDPGYAFRQEQGQKALERQMAAQGVTLGGAGYGDINTSAAQAMTDYSQGLASQEYANAYNRYTNDQLNTFNMLMGASGSGQQVTGQMAQTGANYATNVGNLTTGLAQAQYEADLADQSSGGMFSKLAPLAGAGIGFAFGGPAGAQLGYALGGAAGGALDS